MIGTTEIMVLGGVFVLLFGAAKLPELARAFGSSIGEFKKARKDLESEIIDKE